MSTTALMTRPEPRSPRPAGPLTRQARSFLTGGTVDQALIATFASREAAAEAALDLVASALPVSLELLDRETVRAVGRFADSELNWPGAAVLAIGIKCDADAAHIEQLCTRRGATQLHLCDHPTSVQALDTISRAARPALATIGARAAIDFRVSVSELPQLMRGLALIEDRFAARIGVIADMGTGVVSTFIIGTDADGDTAGAAIVGLVVSRGSSPTA